MALDRDTRDARDDAEMIRLLGIIADHAKTQVIQNGRLNVPGGNPRTPGIGGGGAGGRRGTPPSLGKQLTNLIGSTRVNLGFASPLVGRLASLVGGLTSPFGLAVAAVAAMAAAANHAAQVLQEFSGAKTMSGGTAAQVATLKAIGVPTGQIASKAQSLHEKIASDPFAAQAASRFGLKNRGVPRPFGVANEAEDLVAALQGLRDLGPGVKQLEEARKLGMEDQLELVNTSNDIWQESLRLAKEQDKLTTPEALQNAKDLAGAQRNLATSWENLVLKVSKDVIPMLIKLIKVIGEWFDSLKAGFDWLVENYFKPAQAKGGLVAGMGDIPKPGTGDAAAAAAATQAAAAKTQKEAADAMMKAGQLMREGLFGGGARAAGAIPKAWKGRVLSDNLDNWSVRAGAFNL